MEKKVKKKDNKKVSKKISSNYYLEILIDEEGKITILPLDNNTVEIIKTLSFIDGLKEEKVFCG